MGFFFNLFSFSLPGISVSSLLAPSALPYTVLIEWWSRTRNSCPGLHSEDIYWCVCFSNVGFLCLWGTTYVKTDFLYTEISENKISEYLKITLTTTTIITTAAGIILSLIILITVKNKNKALPWKITINLGFFLFPFWVFDPFKSHYFPPFPHSYKFYFFNEN